MSSYNIKDIIENSKIHELIVKSFSKKFGIDENLLRESFDKLIDKKLNEAGKNYTQSKNNNFGKIENMSSEDFLNQDIKIIKDE